MKSIRIWTPAEDVRRISEARGRKPHALDIISPSGYGNKTGIDTQSPQNHSLPRRGYDITQLRVSYPELLNRFTANRLRLIVYFENFMFPVVSIEINAVT